MSTLHSVLIIVRTSTGEAKLARGIEDSSHVETTQTFGVRVFASRRL